MPAPIVPLVVAALFGIALASSKKKEEKGTYVPAGYQLPGATWEEPSPFVSGADGEQVVRSELVDRMLGVLAGATPQVVTPDRVQLMIPGKGGRDWAEAEAKKGRAVLITTDPKGTTELWSVLRGQENAIARIGSGWAVLLRGALGAAAPGPSPAVPQVPTPPLPPLGPIPGAPPEGVPGLDLVPEPQRTQIANTLKNPLVTPVQLRQLADALVGGNPAIAEWLRKRAGELEGKAAGAVAGGGTYTIREGDNASYLAKHYTGDAGRWRELLTVNPGLVAYNEPLDIVDAKEGKPIVVTKIRPWLKGQVVQVPAGWDLSKGPPPQLSSQLPSIPT